MVRKWLSFRSDSVAGLGEKFEFHETQGLIKYASGATKLSPRRWLLAPEGFSSGGRSLQCSSLTSSTSPAVGPPSRALPLDIAS